MQVINNDDRPAMKRVYYPVGLEFGQRSGAGEFRQDIAQFLGRVWNQREKNKTMKIIAFLIDRKTKDDGTKHSPIVFPIMGVAKCRPWQHLKSWTSPSGF